MNLNVLFFAGQLSVFNEFENLGPVFITLLERR
jgi:hypothetical protein